MGPETAKPRASTVVAIAASCAGVAIAFKAALLALQAFPFYSDEAVVGLMARHIRLGEWPVFFYGQAYLGSTDAVLVAGAFSLFGESVEIIRLVQVALYAATVITTVALATRAGLPTFGIVAAGLIMALPPVNTTLYTTVSIGGYGEALLLGNLMLMSALAFPTSRPTLFACLGWGALVGFGLWTFTLTLVYSVPLSVFLVGRWRQDGGNLLARRLALSALGVAVGAAPLIAWVYRNGFDRLVQESLGSAIAGASSGSILAAALSHAANFVLFGPSVILGARPPWGIGPLALPLLPLAVAFWVAAFYRAVRPRGAPFATPLVGRMLAAVAATLVVGFVLLPFGADPSGRYFLPMSVTLALVGGSFLSYLRQRAGVAWASAALAVPLAFAVWGTLQTALAQPPGITTQFDPAARRDTASDQTLIAFLRERSETRGYTTYWVSYPLAFLSQEDLIFVPRLPYHPDFRYTARDDRYPPYGSLVAASPSVAFITSGQPWLEAFLRDAFASRDVDYRESTIGEYHVFHELSRHVEPAELGWTEP